MNETPSERQLRIAPANLAEVGRSDMPGSPHERLARRVEELLDALEDLGWNQSQIARALGVSHVAVGKWRQPRGVRAMPSALNIAALGTLVQLAREGRVKPGHDHSWYSSYEKERVAAEKASAAEATVVTSVTPPVVPIPVPAIMVIDMASQIAFRELAKARYPELEVCLWYHRKNLEAGALGPRTIEFARAGYLESAGCTAWTAEEWWTRLLTIESRVQAQYDALAVKPADETVGAKTPHGSKS